MDGFVSDCLCTGVEVILASIALFGICFVGIGIGVLFTGKTRVRGSCGGIAAGRADESCDVCGGDVSLCSDAPAANMHYSRSQEAIQKSRG